MQITDNPTYTLAQDGPIKLLYTKRDFGNMSAKVGDLSHRQANYQNLLGLLPSKRNVRMALEHADIIVDVRNTPPVQPDDVNLETYPCDAFIGDISKTNLLMLIADCVPMLLYTPGQTTVAFGHMSRHTITKGLTQQLLTAYLQAAQVTPDMVWAHIGPGVKPESYVFDATFAAQEFTTIWQPYLRQITSDKVAVDVPACLSSLLHAGGLAADHIATDPANTATGPYFSHSHTQKDPSVPDGRNLAAVFID